MTKKKTRPQRTRNSFARMKARVFLRDLGIEGPPINIGKLIGIFGKIAFTKDADDGFTIYDEIRKKYCVFIDPGTIAGRITWTLCHELAHIVLGHFLEYDMDNLTPWEEKILDRECDIFVRGFLMPREWVLKYYEPPLTIPQIGKLKNRFDVSWQAIINRLDELELCCKKDVDSLFKDWHTSREKGQIILSKLAPETPSEKVVIGINYCMSIRTKRRFKVMGDIKIVDCDGNKRFMECPVCGNVDFSRDASFCKICGYYLYNNCLNDEYDPRAINDFCGRANASNALYCEYCGSKTMLYEFMEKNGYSLDAMQEVAATSEPGHIQEKSDFEEVPFTDDDKPW